MVVAIGVGSGLLADIRGRPSAVIRLISRRPALLPTGRVIHRRSWPERGPKIDDGVSQGPHSPRCKHKPFPWISAYNNNHL